MEVKELQHNFSTTQLIISTT